MQEIFFSRQAVNVHKYKKRPRMKST